MSAKHGLIEPDELIEKYDFSIFDMKHSERKKSGSKVKSQLYRKGLIKENMMILAGKNIHKTIERFEYL